MIAYSMCFAGLTTKDVGNEFLRCLTLSAAEQKLLGRMPLSSSQCRSNVVLEATHEPVASGAPSIPLAFRS